SRSVTISGLTLVWSRFWRTVTGDRVRSPTAPRGRLGQIAGREGDRGFRDGPASGAASRRRGSCALLIRQSTASAAILLPFEALSLTQSRPGFSGCAGLYAVFMRGPENPHRFLIRTGLSALKLHTRREFPCSICSCWSSVLP